MAQSDGMVELFKSSPAAFQQVLIQFRVCHDLCVYTSRDVLKSDTLTKIDQCAVDFRHMSIHTTTLADRIASLWCQTCLLFFKNIEKVKHPEKILLKISNQAKDLAEGFKVIAKWCRDLAGRFHEAQNLATANSTEFQERVNQAEKEADELAKDLKSKLDKLQISAQQKRTEAEKWSVRASYPIIGIFWNGTALITSEQARSAEDSARYAEKKSDEAKRQLSSARSSQEKAKHVANEISKLVSCLRDIEKLCECIGAFWQMESDKFGSFGTSVTGVSDFIEIGLESEICDEQIEWLEETQKTFRKYHSHMSEVNAAFNFATYLTPSHFPMIELPSIDVKLE